MPAGRPTKYTPELIEKAWQYLTVWEQIGHKVPSNEGLAVYLEIGMRTLYDWEVDPEKPEFSHIIERL